MTTTGGSNEEFMNTILAENNQGKKSAGGDGNEPPKDGDEPPKDGNEPPKGGDETVKVKDLLGNEYKDINELRSAAERGKKVTDANITELAEMPIMRQKVTDLETTLSNLQTSSPYKDPNYARLEKLKESNPTEFPVFQKLVMGTLSDLDVMSRKALRENPHLKDKPAALTRLLAKDFPLVFDPKADKESQEYKDQVEDFGIAAARERDSITTEFNKVEIGKSWKDLDPQAGAKAEAETLKSEWDTIKPELVKTHDGKIIIEVETTDDQKKVVNKPLVEFEISAGDLQPYVDKAIEFSISKKRKAGVDQKEFIYLTAKNLWVANNLPKYVAKIVEAVTKQKDQEYQEMISGTRGRREPGFNQNKVQEAAAESAEKVISSIPNFGSPQ